MIKNSIINIAIFASITTNSLHASVSRDDVSFTNLDQDTQLRITDRLDEESLAALAHTEKAGTWMVLRELQRRFPAHVKTYQDISTSTDGQPAYRFIGKFIKPSDNAPHSFFFLSSFPFINTSFPQAQALIVQYDKFLACAKPLLKVALLLPPTEESMLCGIQGVHLLLGSSRMTPCQALNNYYFEKDLQPYYEAKIPCLKPPVISNLGYICESFIKLNTQEEFADICNLMFASSMITFVTPRFEDVHTAGKALMNIKDFMYYPQQTHANVIRALITGKIINYSRASFMGMKKIVSDPHIQMYDLPLNDMKILSTPIIKSDRKLEQKMSDFDLMQQVCHHAINDLGFSHSEIEDELIYLNRKLKNAVFNDKQAGYFKKRHLDEAFQ